MPFASSQIPGPQELQRRLAVTAENCTLTIRGQADSEALRQAALRIVGEVPGIAVVTDEIVVMPIVRRYAGT